MGQEQENWNFPKEREIKLTALLWEIIQSWRTIIILVVIITILATGFSYIRSKQSLSMTSSEIKVEDTLTDEELSAVNRVKLLRRYLQERTDYQEESVYINLDAYHVDAVTLQYSVRTESEKSDDAVTVADSYRKYIESGAAAEAAGETAEISLDDAFVGELIELTDEDIDAGQQLGQAEQIGNASVPILSVRVMGKDEQEAAVLAEAVNKALSDYAVTVSEKIAAHQLVLMDQQQSVIVDRDLAVTQENLQASIESLQTKITTLTTAFTETQTAVLNAEYNSEEGEPNDESAPISTPTVSKKYVLLGVILGIVLACVWVALQYILSGKIKAVEELQDMYGLRMLGSVKYEESKKRLFSGIDRWILSLREKNQWSLEEQVRVLLANISVFCQKADIQKVFLTSETLDEATTSNIIAFAEQLRKDGVESVYETNIVYNAASLTHMSEIGNVILIVKEGVTKYKEFEKQLLLCRDQEINILGVIFMK